jgi:gluconolactonase
LLVASFGCSEHSSSATEHPGDAGSQDASVGANRDAGGADAASAATRLQFADIGAAKKISGEFYFSEGPVWDPANDVLYFTDIYANQGEGSGGAVYKLTLPDSIAKLFEPAGNVDGLGLDPDGKLIAAGFGARNVWRLADDNTMTTLAPCAKGTATCYMDRAINTPDDIAARSDGVIYFTDPTFGQALASGSFELSAAQGLYRLTQDGVLHLEEASTGGPNGVNFSPDEKTLYVAYTLDNAVAKFSVAEDGTLSDKTTFATALVADSMCVDALGDVYVAMLQGLQVFGPEGGAALGTIPVGGDVVTNCAFGGSDQRTLFITSHSLASLTGTPTLGSSSLYEIEGMPVPGIPGRN